MFPEVSSFNPNHDIDDEDDSKKPYAKNLFADFDDNDDAPELPTTSPFKAQNNHSNSNTNGFGRNLMSRFAVEADPDDNTSDFDAVSQHSQPFSMGGNGHSFGGRNNVFSNDNGSNGRNMFSNDNHTTINNNDEILDKPESK